MANVSSEIANRANGAATEFKNKIQNSEHPLEKMAQNAGEKMGTMASDFANTTADSLKVGRAYVKENPAKGVAIAATAGLFVGSLLTMALRSRRE